MDMAQGDIPTRVLLASDDPAAEADIKGAFVDGAPSTASESKLAWWLTLWWCESGWAGLSERQKCITASPPFRLVSGQHTGEDRAPHHCQCERFQNRR